MSDPAVRVDKWLWYARFFKSRTRAARQVQNGKIRVNKARVLKPSTPLKIGDVITFAQGRMIRVVTVHSLGARRGPASEAQGLYGEAPPSRPAHRPLGTHEHKH